MVKTYSRILFLWGDLVKARVILLSKETVRIVIFKLQNLPSALSLCSTNNKFWSSKIDL